MTIIFRSLTNVNRTAKSRKRQLRPRPRLATEPLEQRDLLAVFTVLSPSDGVPNDLRSAVAAANLSPGMDTIRFRTDFVQLALGEIVITDAVNIDGATAPTGHVDIVASPAPNPDRIFRVDDASPAQPIVSLNELTLRGGEAAQGGAIFNSEELQISHSTITGNRADIGGGILNRFGRVVLDDVSVYDNTAHYDGGGVTNNEGTLELRDSLVQANRVSNITGASTFGGGIQNIGHAVNILENSRVLGNGSYASGLGRAHGGGISVMLESVVHLIDSDVGDNFASHEGGGIFVVDNSTARVEQNSSVFGNIAGEAGGGMYLLRCTSNISDSTITGNVTELRGGGISAGNDVTLQMTQSRISDNTTEMYSNDGSGGGLYLSGFGAANGPTVTISGSTIHRNNYGPTGLPGGELGGGISVRYGARLSMDNTEISQNLASISGGGIYSSDQFSPFAPHITMTGSRILENRSDSVGGGITMAGGTLEVTQTSIDLNSAGGRGGGLFLTGLGSFTPLQTDVVDSTISGNFARLEGGGASVGPGTTLTVDQSRISDNGTYGRGGGLYLTELNSAAPHVTHITRSQLLNNRATYDPNGPSDAFGGGVFAALGVELDVDSTTVSGNRADNVGGGFVLAENTVVTVQDSTISQNASGSHGGGFYLKNADVTFDQNTVYANRAAGHGGGLFVYSALQNQVKVSHNTITGNHGNINSVLGQGGGIYVDNVPANHVRLDLDHSIVARNQAGLILGSDFDIFDAGAHMTAHFNLVGNNQGSGLAAGNPDAQGNLIGTSVSPIDPLLGPLAANGGPTSTMLPMSGSPAIDAGDPSLSPPGGFDQRHAPFERVRHGRIDIGSVETRPPLAPVDFNLDGLADCQDVDLLVAQIASGVYLAPFDMNFDGLLDLSDLNKWLDDAPQYNGLNFQYYLPGDANLDGIVDGSDFAVWNSNKFLATAAWCSGDFNADGSVDGADFNIWNANKFTSSPPCPCPRPSHPNPEPNGPRHDLPATILRQQRPPAVPMLAPARMTVTDDDDNDRADRVDEALLDLYAEPVEQSVQLVQSAH